MSADDYCPTAYGSNHNGTTADGCDYHGTTGGSDRSAWSRAGSTAHAAHTGRSFSRNRHDGGKRCIARDREHHGARYFAEMSHLSSPFWIHSTIWIQTECKP
ncbi:MAG: hypothetical protein JWM36_3451 [Hyphomicrobiales bacterium]|nr:hypothetical protein [Hyphomicrobiales bacterium]